MRGVGVFNDRGTLFLTDIGKARCLANHYSAVFTQEHPGSIPGLPICQRRASIDHPLHTVLIMECGFAKRLHALGPNKCPGPNSLHPVEEKKSLYSCILTYIHLLLFDWTQYKIELYLTKSHMLLSHWNTYCCVILLWAGGRWRGTATRWSSRVVSTEHPGI